MPDEAYRMHAPVFAGSEEVAGVKIVRGLHADVHRARPQLLKRLSEATGLHILTNTGLYKEPFLPDYAFKETAEQLAARWIAEFKNGIEGTGIKPGFIKIAVNPGKLIDVQKKIIHAATITSRKTGLTIGCHTGHGEAALKSLTLLKALKFPLRKVHRHPLRRHSRVGNSSEDRGDRGVGLF